MEERKTCLVLTEDRPTSNGMVEVGLRADSVVAIAREAMEELGFSVRAGREFNDKISFTVALTGADAMVVDAAIDSDDLFGNLERYRAARDVPVIYLVDKGAKTPLRDVLAVSYDREDPDSIAEAVARVRSYASHFAPAFQRQEVEPLETDPSLKQCLVLAPALPQGDRRRFELSLRDALGRFEYGVVDQAGIKDLSSLVMRFQSADAVVLHLPGQVLDFFRAIDEGEGQGRPVVIVADGVDGEHLRENSKFKKMLLLPKGAPSWADENAKDIALAVAAKTSRLGRWNGTGPESCDRCGEPIGSVFYDTAAGEGPNARWGCVCEKCAPANGTILGPARGQRYERAPDGTFVLTAGWPLYEAAEE